VAGHYPKSGDWVRKTQPLEQGFPAYRVFTSCATMLNLQNQEAFDRVVSTGSCSVGHRGDRLTNLILKQRRPREPLCLRGGPGYFSWISGAVVLECTNDFRFPVSTVMAVRTSGE
jgi:hypothetical protein